MQSQLMEPAIASVAKLKTMTFVYARHTLDEWIYHYWLQNDQQLHKELEPLAVTNTATTVVPRLVI